MCITRPTISGECKIRLSDWVTLDDFFLRSSNKSKKKNIFVKRVVPTGVWTIKVLLYRLWTATKLYLGRVESTIHRNRPEEICGCRPTHSRVLRLQTRLSIQRKCCFENPRLGFLSKKELDIDTWDTSCCQIETTHWCILYETCGEGTGRRLPKSSELIARRNIIQTNGTLSKVRYRGWRTFVGSRTESYGRSF